MAFERLVSLFISIICHAAFDSPNLHSSTVGSLYALMIQMIIIITAKVSSNPLVLLAVLLVTGRLMYYVHNE